MIDHKVRAIVPEGKFSIWYGALPFAAETDASSDYLDHGEYIIGWHKSNAQPCPGKDAIAAAIPVAEAKQLILESIVAALKAKGTLTDAEIEAAKK